MRGIATSRKATFALYGSLTVMSIVWLVPMFTALMISLLPLRQSQHGWWNFSPQQLTLRSYANAWHQGLSSYTVNSLIIAVLAVGLTVTLGTLAAYAFARLPFRAKGILYFLLITTMIVPVQIILIPLLPWFETLHLNSGAWQFFGIALVHTAFGAGWAVFMLGTFFRDIPEELLEAARVDGAGTLSTFRRVALPLAVPGVVSFAIIDFVFVWNDLLLGLTLTGGVARAAGPAHRL